MECVAYNYEYHHISVSLQGNMNKGEETEAWKQSAKTLKREKGKKDILGQ